jgi:hypothetical protein
MDAIVLIGRLGNYDSPVVADAVRVRVATALAGPSTARTIAFAHSSDEFRERVAACVAGGRPTLLTIYCIGAATVSNGACCVAASRSPDGGSGAERLAVLGDVAAKIRETSSEARVSLLVMFDGACFGRGRKGPTDDAMADAVRRHCSGISTCCVWSVPTGGNDDDDDLEMPPDDAVLIDGPSLHRALLDNLHAAICDGFLVDRDVGTLSEGVNAALRRADCPAAVRHVVVAGAAPWPMLQGASASSRPSEKPSGKRPRSELFEPARGAPEVFPSAAPASQPPRAAADLHPLRSTIGHESPPPPPMPLPPHATYASAASQPGRNGDEWPRYDGRQGYTPPPSTYSGGPPSAADLPQTSYFCDVCHCDVPGEMNWRAHLAGKSHAKRLKAANVAPMDAGTHTAMMANPDNYFHCSYCNVQISGEAQVRQHLEGRQHLAKMRLQTGRSDPWGV